MKTYWIIVRVWRGLADKVWLFDDETAAISEFKDLKDHMHKKEDGLQMFEVEHPI